MNFIKANFLSFITLGLMAAVTLFLYGDLPDRMPTNYDLNGVARSDSAKELVATIIPASYVLVIILTNVLIAISPVKFSMPNSKRAMDIIIFGVGLMLLSIHIGLLIAGGEIATFLRYFTIGMALFLLVVGNVFGKTERNFFIGIRLPWTLASEANWRATHRFAGKLMVVFGVLLLVTTIFWVNLPLILVLSICPLLIPAVYSYLYFARHERTSDQTPKDELTK